MFLETKIDLNEQEKELIKFVLSFDMPWYFSNQDVYPFFRHTLMNRNKEDLPIKGDINSDLYSHFESIFLRVCKENNIEINNILRMALNNTYFFKDKHNDIHKDHAFPHHNFLWYINDFTNGSTYLFENDKKTMKKEIKSEKNKITIFDGGYHAQGFCNDYENRIVLIATFN